MHKFGLIGRTLKHSFSEKYFTEKFLRMGLSEEYQYKLYEMPTVEGISDLGDLDGFNVTIPYKLDIIPHLAGMSDEARQIGAVNCVKRTPEGLWGYNTDAYGVQMTLEKLLGEDFDIKALILGTGGASQAVQYVLAQNGIEYLIVSRSYDKGNITYQDITPEILQEYRLIINATPLGTFPNVDTKPDLPYERLSGVNYLYDLVYNPDVTAFMAEGQKSGAQVINGLTMLTAQAEKSWQIWTSKE